MASSPNNPPATNPPECVGTWEYSTGFRKNGQELPPLPPSMPKVRYVYIADGTGTMMAGVLPMPMRWSVAEDRVRMRVKAMQSQDTVVYQFDDANTLVLFDRHGGRNIFRRVAVATNE